MNNIRNKARAYQVLFLKKCDNLWENIDMYSNDLQSFLILYV